MAKALMPLEKEFLGRRQILIGVMQDTGLMNGRRRKRGRIRRGGVVADTAERQVRRRIIANRMLELRIDHANNGVGPGLKLVSAKGRTTGTNLMGAHKAAMADRDVVGIGFKREGWTSRVRSDGPPNASLALNGTAGSNTTQFGLRKAARSESTGYEIGLVRRDGPRSTSVPKQRKRIAGGRSLIEFNSWRRARLASVVVVQDGDHIDLGTESTRRERTGNPRGSWPGTRENRTNGRPQNNQPAGKGGAKKVALSSTAASLGTAGAGTVACRNGEPWRPNARSLFSRGIRGIKGSLVGKESVTKPCDGPEPPRRMLRSKEKGSLGSLATTESATMQDIHTTFLSAAARKVQTIHAKSNGIASGDRRETMALRGSWTQGRSLEFGIGRQTETATNQGSPKEWSKKVRTVGPS